MLVQYTSRVRPDRADHLERSLPDLKEQDSDPADGEAECLEQGTRESSSGSALIGGVAYKGGAVETKERHTKSVEEERRPLIASDRCWAHGGKLGG